MLALPSHLEHQRRFVRVNEKDQLAYWHSKEEFLRGAAPIKGLTFPVTAFDVGPSRRSTKEFILAPARGAVVKAGTRLRVFEFSGKDEHEVAEWMAFLKQRIATAPRFTEAEAGAGAGAATATGSDAAAGGGAVLAASAPRQRGESSGAHAARGHGGAGHLTGPDHLHR